MNSAVATAPNTARNGNGDSPVRTKRNRRIQEALVTTPGSFAAPEDQLNQVIAIGMCGVDAVVKRPSGSVKIPGVQVSAMARNGETMTIAKTTKPGFIFDDKEDHEIWSLLDLNQRAIEGTIEKFSINDARRGFHLVPMSKTGNLLAELRRLRRERLELVEQLKSPVEWQRLLDNLRVKYPDHFHLLKPLMPNPDTLLEKFDVTWTLNPLTPVDPAALDYNNMNEHDKQQIIDESNRMAQSLVKARASAIYDDVFNAFLKKCDEIIAGSFESGMRKFSDVEVLVAQVERLRNFAEFGGNPEVMTQHATNVLSVLGGITNKDDIGKINSNKGNNAITKALKAAMEPIGEEIRSMYAQTAPGSGKARRSLE